MQKASRVLAAGAQFLLLGARDTMVPAKKPVIAVTAIRTGCGKSQTARALAEQLRKRGKRVVGVRHSMPYGPDLTVQACQRFAVTADFTRHRTTIEEEEDAHPGSTTASSSMPASTTCRSCAPPNARPT